MSRERAPEPRTISSISLSPQRHGAGEAVSGMNGGGVGSTSYVVPSGLSSGRKAILEGSEWKNAGRLWIPLPEEQKGKEGVHGAWQAQSTPLFLDSVFTNSHTFYNWFAAPNRHSCPFLSHSQTCTGGGSESAGARPRPRSDKVTLRLVMSVLPL